MTNLYLEALVDNLAEFRFFNEVGNTLAAINPFVKFYHEEHKPSQLAIIQMLKQTFYKQLARFQDSNYTPKGKINQESLDNFYHFQRMRWENPENFKKVMKYFSSLRTIE